MTKKVTKHKKLSSAQKTSRKKTTSKKSAPKILPIKNPIEKIYISDYITLEAQADLIVDVLSRYNWPTGKIFSYSQDFYNTSEAFTKELLEWLKIKNLEVTIIKEPELHTMSTYVVSKDKLLIYIRDDGSLSIYAKAALVSQALGEYMVIEKFGIELQNNTQNKTQFLQVACVYLGLGVVILNGINRTTSWIDQLWNNYIRSKTESAKFPEEYANIFVHFIEQFNCDINSIAGQLMPWVPSFLPSRYAMVVRDSTTFSKATKYAQTKRMGNNLSHFGILFLFIVLIFGSWFLINQNDDELSSAQRDNRENLEVLKHQYNLCVKNVQQKQEAYSKDDVFFERSIQADLSRCESIRNNYNFEADKFNESIGQGPENISNFDQP